MPITARSLAWDDFRLIDAIAGAKSLPAAAARLGLDHSTVFRRLRQIETALGTPLFERHRSGYVPTAAGDEIAALAARVDEDIGAVLRRVGGQSPNPAGEVRIATSDTLLFDLLLPLLAEFKRMCPDVRLDLVTGNTALNLSRRDADVAVRATATPLETLVGRNIGPIAWADYGPVAMSSTLPWIGLGDALSGLAIASHMPADTSAAQIACRFDTVAGALAGIEAGIGHGFLPCFAGDRHPSLVRLSPPIQPTASDLWLLTHADLRNVPRVRILMDFLGDRLAALRPYLAGTDPLSAPPAADTTNVRFTPDTKPVAPIGRATSLTPPPRSRLPGR